MAITPSIAAAAYQSVAKIGADVSTTAAQATATQPAGPNFGDFLTNAMKDVSSTMRQGEQMASLQATGKANIVDVVNAVNQAEITLDTVVAVRDKVISAYQDIMRMPI